MKKSSSDNRRLTAFINRIDGLTNSQRNSLLYFKSLYIRHGARALHPSMATIAKKCRISERSAQYAVRALEHYGFIRLVANEKGGCGKSRHYAFVELAVLEAAYVKGCNETPKIAPFIAGKKGAEIAPEYLELQSSSFPYPSKDISWARGKVESLFGQERIVLDGEE